MLVSKIGVAWARGQAPDVAYAACRVGRLITPWKPKGGIRPLVITAALRRIVLKSLARVMTPTLQSHMLPMQHAIGVPGGAEKLFHAVTTMQAVIPRSVIVALDLRNAFGSMSRGVMRQAMQEVAPELDALVTRLYAGPTPLVWECDGGGAMTFQAKTGVDAGCPFSCLLFCLGLHKVLRATAQAMPQATFKAFMYDVYTV